MSKEEQIRLMAASIYGGLIARDRYAAQAPLQRLAIRQALQIYNGTIPVIRETEEKYEGCDG